MTNIDKYNIRLESIGGMGANLAGKMLGDIGAMYYGLNAQSFAEYGSEKRGSPVKSYIRFSKKDIRANSPVRYPDLVALFSIHTAGKENTMSGVKENTAVVVNSKLSPWEVRDRLEMYAGSLYVIDALSIAMEYKTRINTVMLGAIAKASGFIEQKALEWVISETLGKKYPEKTEANIKGAMEGYNKAEKIYFPPDKYPYREYKDVKNKWGYMTAPIGGINTFFGSTATNDLSGSREGYIPLLDRDKCINCGLCDTTCPDMCFQFIKTDKGIKNLGIDYKYCKGCLRCAEVCPTKAINVDLEEKHNVKKLTVDCIELINKDFQYTDTGSNSWVESVSNMANSEN